MLVAIFSFGMIFKFITLLWILSLSTCSLSVLVNVSIDDTLGDETNNHKILYTNEWKFGQSCVDCTAKPDADQAYRNTWHDATFAPVSLGGDGKIRSATTSFNGVFSELISCLQSVDESNSCLKVSPFTWCAS